MPNPPPRALVFDAFGTLVRIREPTRPFARLRARLEDAGFRVPDFATAAMTAPYTFASLAQRYGHTLTETEHAVLDEELAREVASVEPFSDAEAALRRHWERGGIVVVGSNLGLAYAAPVRRLLERIGPVSALGEPGRLRTAFSFDIGALKPEPRFYRCIQEALARTDNVQPNEIAMIGDKQAEDVDGPTAAGWQAWRVDRPAGATLLNAPFLRPPGPKF